MRIGMVSEWQSNGDLKEHLKQRPEADRYDLVGSYHNGQPVSFHSQFPAYSGDGGFDIPS